MVTDDEKRYTQDEVSHLVAREVAKQRMADMERSISNTNDQVVKMWAKIEASFDSLKKSINERDNDLRREIERDFATKLEVEQMRGELNKIWLKVSLPVGTLLIALEFIFKLFK